MAFHREIQGHLLIDGAWVDVSSDIRQTSAITITRGGGEEDRRPTPAKCRLTLNNRHRMYSPHNPLSPYYKRLGRNTPITVRALVARDEFGGTTVNGWGSADPCGIRDDAYAWTNAGPASDFAEGSGSATHLIPAAATAIYSYLPDVSYRDVGVLVEGTVAVNNITGGPIELASILLRGGSTFYIIQVLISAAEVLTVGILDFTGAPVAAPVTAVGVVDAVSSKTISVRAEAEGEILRARVWKTGQPEPGAWTITTEDRTYLSAGWVGVRSATGAGNTNTPVTMSYSRVEVYSPRYAGEVADWPQERTSDGADRTVTVEAWDLFQRLRQGKSPVMSALRRGITGMTTPAVAYWPCEDGSDATVVASDSPALPMSIGGALPDFASSNDFACSGPLLVLNGSALFGAIPTYTPTSGQSQIRLLVSVPAGGDTNGEKILRVSMVGGTTGFWDIVYGTGGTLTLNVFDPAGASLLTVGPIAYAMDGRPVRLTFQVTQNGADIDWLFGTLEAIPGAIGGFNQGTLAGRTYGRIDWINVGGDALFTGVAVGHITAQGTVDSMFALLAELVAYVGERAQARISKLFRENNITAYVGESTTGAQLMGAQRPKKLLDLLEECVEADLGGLASCRGQVAPRYVRLSDMYNQAPAVVLDLAGGQLTECEPDWDNFPIQNKIIARRINGSEYTATQTTGRLAAVDPIDGGVGVYDDTPEVNVNTDLRLPEVAHYRLLQGTIDRPRFPDLTVNMGTGAMRAAEEATRQLLDLDLWQRLQVDNASSVDLYDTVDLSCRGYTEVLSRGVHLLTVNGAPYDPYRIVELDNDDCDRLDSGTTTLNEDLDATEISVEVAITDGTLWGSDTPYDIDVGGERMTVTAVAGAASPQTLTVTRNVNGLPGGKTHTAGDQVRLADDYYLAGW